LLQSEDEECEAIEPAKGRKTSAKKPALQRPSQESIDSHPVEKKLAEEGIAEVVAPAAPRSRTRKSVSSVEAVLAPAPHEEQAIISTDTGKQRASRAKPSKLEQAAPPALCELSKETSSKSSKSAAKQKEAPVSSLEAVKEGGGKSKAAKKVVVEVVDEGPASKGKTKAAARQEEVAPVAAAAVELARSSRSSKSKVEAKQEAQPAEEEKTTGRTKAAKASTKKEPTPAEEAPAPTRRSTRRAH
jgi:hypothetical protein